MLVWAVVSTTWVAAGFRTQDVPDALLASDGAVVVDTSDDALRFVPVEAPRAALVFLCGAGVSAEAYAPLLRPLASERVAVTIVRLPWRLAPLAGQRDEAVVRAVRALRDAGDLPSLVAGHSLGAALACRVVAEHPGAADALALVATTHPKRHDLSGLSIPVTKIVGDVDGVAPLAKVSANRPLLPAHTRLVTIEGANHVQFAHYGHQLLDGRATIPRDEQQRRTRDALRALVTEIKPR